MLSAATGAAAGGDNGQSAHPSRIPFLSWVLIAAGERIQTPQSTYPSDV